MKQKNARLLVDAAPFVDAPIKIAGDTSFEQSSIVKGGRVEFLGKLSTAEVAAQLAQAAIYVLPAKYEPFGLSALEAALSGCALVLGNIRTLREIWSDAAIYVDTNNPKELAAAINELATDRNECKRWGEIAKQRAANYSLEKMGRNYWQRYCRLVQETTKHIGQEIA